MSSSHTPDHFSIPPQDPLLKCEEDQPVIEPLIESPNPIFDQIFYKVLNAKECHKAFQYSDGVNVLKGRFSTFGTCVPGGLYVCELKHILEFLHYGTKIRLVSISQFKSNPSFQMVRDSNDKLRANMIHLGDSMPLDDSSTYLYLQEQGLNLQDNRMEIMKNACREGYLNVLKFTFEVLGLTINDIYVKYFVIDIVGSGSVEVLDYALTRGPNMRHHFLHIEDLPYYLRKHSSLDMAKRLIELGYEFDLNKSAPIYDAYNKNNIMMVDFYLGLGMKFHSYNNLPHQFKYVFKKASKETLAHIEKNSPTDIDSFRITDFETFLAFAIFGRNNSMIEFLTAKINGIDPNFLFASEDILKAVINIENILMVRAFLKTTKPSVIVRTAMIVHSYQVVDFVLEYDGSKKLLEETFDIACDIPDYNYIKILMERGVDYSNVDLVAKMILAKEKCQIVP